MPFTGKAPSPHTIIIIFVFLAYGRKSLSVEDVIEEGKFKILNFDCSLKALYCLNVFND